jgi:hypothetical protein
MMMMMMMMMMMTMMMLVKERFGATAYIFLHKTSFDFCSVFLEEYHRRVGLVAKQVVPQQRRINPIQYITFSD